VFSKNLPRTLPYALRVEAHTLSTGSGGDDVRTQGPQRPNWLLEMGVKVPDPESFRAAAAKLQRNRLLVFSRWTQVMMRFEKGLYANPDQDLNKLWWDLVEKYQELKRPEGRDEPDFAAKYHIGLPRSTSQLRTGRDVRLAVASRPGQGRCAGCWGTPGR